MLSSLVEENSLRPNLRVRDIDPFVGSLDMATTNRIHEGERGMKNSTQSVRSLLFQEVDS